jgi:hypothetical protein
MDTNNVLQRMRQSSEKLAGDWSRRVRRETVLKKYNSFGDPALLDMNRTLFRNLALWLDGEIDRNQAGSFFVDLGKVRRSEGFPVSEVAYALMLVQRTVLDFFRRENTDRSPEGLDAVLDLTGRAADFFYLGAFYMLKGHLEDTYIAFSRHEALPNDVLKKYFFDDFYFK